MPLIERFDASPSGARVSLRSIGQRGRGLAVQLNRERGTFRIHFEREGRPPLVIHANVLDARFLDRSAGGLEDSSLDLSLQFDDPGTAHGAMFELLKAAEPVEVTFELLP